MKNIKGVVSLSGAVHRSAGDGSGTPGELSRSKRKSGSGHSAKKPASGVKIYTAPSLEGGDEEYKKLVSGKVDNNKPSFA